MQYFNLAQLLLGQRATGERDEATLRCAVSRCYYSAFCSARNHARDRFGWTPSYKPEDHSDVKRQFALRARNKVADGLDRLRQWRNQCDYDDEVPNVEILAKEAVKTTKVVFSELK
jgi:uncharacterized protein (UPF0332 family)